MMICLQVFDDDEDTRLNYDEFMVFYWYYRKAYGEKGADFTEGFPPEGYGPEEGQLMLRLFGEGDEGKLEDSTELQMVIKYYIYRGVCIRAADGMLSRVLLCRAVYSDVVVHYCNRGGFRGCGARHRVGA